MPLIVIGRILKKSTVEFPARKTLGIEPIFEFYEFFAIIFKDLGISYGLENYNEIAKTSSNKVCPLFLMVSYYLLKGMREAADLNGDGKITLAELKTYVKAKVSSQAKRMGTERTQEPMVIGRKDRVLVWLK